MHPRFLKTFLAVARHLNVTRAAQEVHLAQSSVSDQIQSLEGELGTALFERARTGLVLTAAGEVLRTYAEEILALTDEARAAVESVAGADGGGANSAGGVVTLGALETIAAARLPDWMARFSAAQPGIRLVLKVAGSGGLLRGVLDSDMDLAFCFERGAPDERLARRVITEEPMVLVAPAASEAAGALVDELPTGEAGLAALTRFAFVATERGCIYRHLFEEAFARAGLPAPTVAAEAGSIGAIGRMVAAGAGLALVPQIAVAQALERGDLKELKWPGGGPDGAEEGVPARPLTAALALFWRRRRVQPPALKQVLAALEGGFGTSDLGTGDFGTGDSGAGRPAGPAAAQSLRPDDVRLQHAGPRRS
ncbi:LysR family transcriptional regulator [Radicibacter daui]|uniref:LysR family transcriptional regulator n=1 Tax=Radicibacter daui TaxID=3064829 RepID=UPI004046F0B3